MKLSCCSLRRISRTRKLVLTIKPAISTANKITPKNSMTPSRQFRMIQPTLSATASATRPTPSTMKKAIVLRRLEICMQPFARDDCISQLECNGENDPSLADRPRRCPPVERGASLPVDTTPNRKRPSDRNTIGKRSRAATPEISPARQCGKHCKEEAESPSGGDIRRARTPVAPKAKRAAESRPQKPLNKSLIRELCRHQPAIRRGYQPSFDLGQIHLPDI